MSDGFYRSNLDRVPLSPEGELRLIEMKHWARVDWPPPVIVHDEPMHVSAYEPIGRTHDYDGPSVPFYNPPPPPDPPERLPYRSEGVDWGDPINALLAGALFFGGLSVLSLIALVVVALSS